MERVNFTNQNKLKNNTEDAFIFQRERIKECIPHADIQHVASSAVPNSLTKDDLDIQFRISSQQFPKAVKALSILYDMNDCSVKTDDFRAFKDDTMSPPLGVQLTVYHSEYDFFWKFCDVLLQNEKLRMDYDNLKGNFAGKAIDKYREAKNDFFNEIKQTTEYQ